MTIAWKSKHFEIKGYKHTFTMVQETEVKVVPCFLPEHDEGFEVHDDIIVKSFGNCSG